MYCLFLMGYEIIGKKWCIEVGGGGGLRSKFFGFISESVVCMVIFIDGGCF